MHAHARSCISPFVMNTMVGGCRKTYKHCGISKWGQANKDVRKFKFHWFIFTARDRGNLSAVLFSLRRMAWFRRRRKARDNTTDSPTATAGPVNRRLNWNIYWWAFHWHFIRMISELLSSYSYFVAAMSLTSVISPLFLATWYSLQFIQIASVVSACSMLGIFRIEVCCTSPLRLRLMGSIGRRAVSRLAAARTLRAAALRRNPHMSPRTMKVRCMWPPPQNKIAK